MYHCIYIYVLVQIDEVLKDKEKGEVMVTHVEQLLLAMSMQFKMAYTTHMEDEDTNKDDVVRLYRCLLGTLLAVSIYQVLVLVLAPLIKIIHYQSNGVLFSIIDSIFFIIDYSDYK